MDCDVLLVSTPTVVISDQTSLDSVKNQVSWFKLLEKLTPQKTGLCFEEQYVQCGKKSDPDPNIFQSHATHHYVFVSTSKTLDLIAHCMAPGKAADIYEARCEDTEIS